MTATLEKMLPFQGLIKTLLIFVLVLIMIAIFFIGFSAFFIPLLFTGIIIAMLYFTGIAQRMPPWQTMVFVFLAFGMGYFIQRISIVSMSSVEGQMPSTTDAWFPMIGLALFILAFAYLASKMKTKGRISWRMGK